MIRDPNNLGGAKTKMRAGSTDLLVNYGTARKAGYYELCPQGRTVYRRVELPEWISSILDDKSRRDSLLTLLQQQRITVPETETGQRQGHIWFQPSKFVGFDVPCVGVDTEIVEGQLRKYPNRNLSFVVYRFGKLEVERWRISSARFIADARIGKPHALFEEQFFVPVTSLER